MHLAPLDVLYEDNHLLALNKPAGLATMGVSLERPSLLSVAKAYVKGRYQKPGNVYLGVVSRLDVPVSGVVLVARTSKAARRMAQQFRARQVEKVYWAVVEGHMEPATAHWVDYLGQHPRHRRMRIVGPAVPGAKEARMSYRRVKLLGGDSLLEVEIETGRKHQIRLQLADRGHPILGDRKYGGCRAWPQGIALHALRLGIVHPVRGEPLTIQATLPQAWKSLGVPTP